MAMFVLLTLLRLRQLREMITVLEKPLPRDAAAAGESRKTPARARDAIDQLVAAATPHFALQLRARVAELIAHLDCGDEVRAYGQARMEMLEALAFASSIAAGGPRSHPESRIGRERLPSSARLRVPDVYRPPH
jgi:hypothetical protein